MYQKTLKQALKPCSTTKNSWICGCVLIVHKGCFFIRKLVLMLVLKISDIYKHILCTFDKSRSIKLLHVLQPRYKSILFVLNISTLPFLCSKPTLAEANRSTQVIFISFLHPQQTYLRFYT